MTLEEVVSWFVVPDGQLGAFPLIFVHRLCLVLYVRYSMFASTRNATRAQPPPDRKAPQLAPPGTLRVQHDSMSFGEEAYRAANRPSALRMRFTASARRTSALTSFGPWWGRGLLRSGVSVRRAGRT